jgi:hypothetical protein
MSRDFGMVTLSYSVALGSKPIQNRFPAATLSPNIEQPALRNLSLLWPSQLLHSLARFLQGLPTGLVQFERSEPNIKILSNLFLDCFPFLFPSTPQHDKIPKCAWLFDRYPGFPLRYDAISTTTLSSICSFHFFPLSLAFR